MSNRRSPDIPKSTDPDSRAKSATPRQARAAQADKPARAQVTREARHALIAENAYLRAELRGFAPGHETEDWLAAEIEVDALLKARHGGSPQ